MLLKNVENGKPDALRTMAVAGFVFTILVTTSLIVASWILGNPGFLEHLAGIIVALTGPTITPYTAKRIAERKYGCAAHEPETTEENP